MFEFVFEISNFAEPQMRVTKQISLLLPHEYFERKLAGEIP